MDHELLIRIDAPLFCGGLVCQFIDGEYVAVDSAPVLKDMIGWDIDRILNYTRTRTHAAVSVTAVKPPLQNGDLT